MTTDSLLHVLQRLGPAGRALLDALGHRMELAAHELTVARNEIASSLVLGAAALVLVLLGGIALTFAIAAAVWHLESRGLWLALLTLAYLVAAAMLGLAMRRRLRRVTFLAETARQLGEDRICLGLLLRGKEPS
jgi:uncharacterized membrane protein YqjE